MVVLPLDCMQDPRRSLAGQRKVLINWKIEDISVSDGPAGLPARAEESNIGLAGTISWRSVYYDRSCSSSGSEWN